MRAVEPAAEQGFPRTYRRDARARRVANELLVTVAGLFLFLTALQIASSGPLRSLVVVDLVIGAWVAVLGSAYNRRVILHQDAIEVVGWFYSSKLALAEIRGRQTTGSSRLPFPYAYILVPSDKSKRKLLLPAHLQTDQFFRDWIKSVPTISR